MPGSSSDDILRPYRAAVARHGPGFEATLWGSREAQRARFRVMVDLAGIAGGRILDVGCGAGDLAAALLEDEVPFASYLGIDALPEMIDAAKARGLARCRFEARDVLADAAALTDAAAALGGAPDFVCLSGTLNTMDDRTARDLVRRSFDVAAQAVVFNFLSNRPHARWAGRDLAPARRFDTVAWIHWALGLSSQVDFTQTYLDGHDATIVIRHDD
jgi:SAM-dependent methyltransferase